MPKVTIEVSRLEETQMHQLLDIEKRAFPGERVIRYYHGAVARIEVEGNDAGELIDMLCIALDDPASECCGRKAQNEDQASLPIFDSDNPIHATAR